MFQYINPFYFFMALFVGLFITYISTPTPDIIFKYPTPENAGKIIYKDNASVCYRYKSQEVACPEDKSKIMEFEPQHNDNDDKNNENMLDKLKNKFFPKS